MAILLAIAVFSVVLSMPQPAYASCPPAGPGPITVSFDSCDYGRDLAGGPVPTIGTAIITVTDPSANLDPTTRDTVAITVTSHANPTGIQLTLRETGVNTGVFTGQVSFMTGNYIFPEFSSLTVTQKYQPATGSPFPSTITENVRSDMPSSTTITLSETGVDTGIYQGKLHFNTFSSLTQNTIFATGGSYIQTSIVGAATWMLLTPNSNSSKGIILVNSSPPTTDGCLAYPCDDTITATYMGISKSVTEGILGTPGGGGGGIVSPGLVLDVLASATGGSAPPPPSFSFHFLATANVLSQSAENEIANQDPLTPIGPSNDKSVPYFPLTIDGKGYLLGGYANTLQTVTEDVAKQMSLTLTTVSRPVVHISLFANLHSIYDTMTDSDTYIIYDRGEPLKVVDPHGFFSSVTLDTKVDGTKQSFTYNIVFAKPMPKSNIMIRAWDDHVSSTDMSLFDAIQAVAQKSTAALKSSTPQTTIVQNIPLNAVQNTGPAQSVQPSPELADYLKEWAGYSPTSISDSQLLSQIGIDGKFIPPWYMKTSKWVVNGDVSQQEFVDAIKYMYQKGIIH